MPSRWRPLPRPVVATPRRPKRPIATKYGYKNHINIDKAHKLIRRYAVTDASVHDSPVFDELIDGENGDRSTWADSAYRSEAREEQLLK
jgi:IS5 family transposase